MDVERLIEAIEKRIWEVIVSEVGGRNKVFHYEPVIKIIERPDGTIDVDISIDLELSPYAKKSKDEVLEVVWREVDKLIQEITGKKPIE